MKVLALILARGGSKRVPEKNIKLLGGKPLIAYTIECAKRSKYINRIIVSTDDNKIAEISSQYGAEVPFSRPREIAQDDSTELQAFEHALNWLKEKENYIPDLIVKLFATAPFRRTESIDKAVELLKAHPEADCVRSVRLCSEHPYKMWTMEDGYLKSFVPLEQKPKEAHTLSYQVLPTVYIQNANIDVTKPSNIWNKKSITGTIILPLIMDEFESVDINTQLDFILAETLFKEVAGRHQNQLDKKETLKNIFNEDLESYKDYLTVDLDCIVCGSGEYKLWAQYCSFKAVQCLDCGLIWIKPFLNDAGRHKYYSDYIGMRFKDEVKTGQRQIQYQIDKELIQAFISTGKVLDVGCSGGFFLNILNSSFEKHGIEIDSEAVNFARTNYPFGGNVVSEDLLSAPYPNESFDLIIMRGVIEHLPDPRAAVGKVAELLKPGGFFYIAATPNSDSFCASLYLEKWNQFHPIRHLFYFNARTLAKLCCEFGLELIAKDFPYMGTPYADVENDHAEVLNALRLKEIGKFDRVKRSPAFWGNMMNLVFRKVKLP